MLKLVTFNIRCDYGQDGDNNFEYRKPFILEKLTAERPDLICFQEVLPHVAIWLKENLADYYVIGCGRSETLEDEQMTIAFRKKRLNLISMETFWLSPTPCIPGSRYEEQSICPRVCTEAVLEVLPEKQVFRLVNLHLDHMGSRARLLGLEQIVRRMNDSKSFTDAPIILTGDFNAEPDAPELKQMEKWPEFRLLTGDIGITYHGFLPEDTPGSIDHIFIRDGKHAGLRALTPICWKDQKKGLWLSDHYPICTTLFWEKE